MDGSRQVPWPLLQWLAGGSEQSLAWISPNKPLAPFQESLSWGIRGPCMGSAVWLNSIPKPPAASVTLSMRDMHKTQCLLSALGNDSSHSLATFQFTKHLLLLKHFPTFHTHSDSLMIPFLRLGPKQEPAQGSALGKPERRLDIPTSCGRALWQGQRATGDRAGSHFASLFTV